MSAEKKLAGSRVPIRPATSSASAFLSRLIDYAGLFPPASLPLDTAIRNFAAYRSGKDAWMLGRLIIPAARLDELQPYVPLFDKGEPLAISALGRKSANGEAGLEALRADFENIDAFCSRFQNKVKVEVLEVPLPALVPTRELLAAISDQIVQRGMSAFCEVPLLGNGQRDLSETLEIIAAHNAETGIHLGVKLRTGGVKAEDFPTPEQIAAVMIGCRDRGIPMKFTAGLHHPLRMYREEVQTCMHGFINVFAAGMLAHVYKLDVATTAEILADEAPSGFLVTEEGLAWRSLKLARSQIEHLRQTAFCSYGSCSFDEPREDLRALGVLSD